MSETPKRMNSREQKGMIDLLGVISTTALLEDDIGRRIGQIPRGRFRLRGAQTNLASLANDLTHTMPPEQQAHLRRQLPAILMIVGTTAQMPRNYDTAFGRWLSFEELDVVATAIRECCRMCTIEDPSQQRQCIFCKLLDSLPTDKPDAYTRGCGYFTIW